MTGPSPNFALEIVGLNKAFGGLKVTQDVSLAIRPGERRLIIGPNGAGKTTLALDLARRLKTRGIAVHMLSRGHGGTAKGTRSVLPDDTAAVTWAAVSPPGTSPAR